MTDTSSAKLARLVYLTAIAATFVACGGSADSPVVPTPITPTPVTPTTPVPSVATSTVSANPASIVANGTATSTISVQLKDASGQNFTTAVNGAVTFAAPSLGTIGTATNQGNGVWTATYTAGITPGTVTISPRFNGTAFSASAAITLLPGTQPSTEPSWFNVTWDVPTAKDLPPSCATTTPLQLYPVDLGMLKTITARGFVQPGSHNTPIPHLYMNVEPANGALDEQGQPLTTKRLDVNAPSDGVVMGGLSTETKSGSFTYTEYSIGIHVCGTKWIALNHLDGLVAKLAAALNPATTSGKATCTTGTDGTKACTFEGLNIPLGVSEKIGRTSGRAYGLDFAAVNTVGPSAKRLNPKAWLPRWTASVCPIDWYTGGRAAELYTLIKTDGGCGDYAYDVANTPSGVWLSMNSLNNGLNEDQDLTLANDYEVASQRIFSVGTGYSIPGLPSKVYFFTPSTAGKNLDFLLVRPGDVACYDQLRARGPGENGAIVDQKIFIKIAAGATETIQIAGATGQCGAGPYTLPGATTTFGRIVTP